MKKLFIYYSFTGNGDIVAEHLEKEGFEIRKVIEKYKMPKSFFWSVMTGGFRAGISAKGKLVNYDNDVADYDEIIIGSPIWNGRFPPAINSVLSQTDLKDKKVSFILYAGSGEGPKSAKKITKLFPNSQIVFLKEPKKYPEELEKIKELTK